MQFTRIPRRRRMARVLLRRAQTMGSLHSGQTRPKRCARAHRVRHRKRRRGAQNRQTRPSIHRATSPHGRRLLLLGASHQRIHETTQIQAQIEQEIQQNNIVDIKIKNITILKKN